MAITAGDNLNSVPAPIKQTLQNNYLDFNWTMLGATIRSIFNGKRG